MDQYLVQAFYAVMISVIAFFLRRLISEHTQTREIINTLVTDIRVAQHGATSMMTQIAGLSQEQQKTNDRLTDLMERMVRIEERTAVDAGDAVPLRRRKA